jgi:hypothetical protein
MPWMMRECATGLAAAGVSRHSLGESPANTATSISPSTPTISRYAFEPSTISGTSPKSIGCPYGSSYERPGIDGLTCTRCISTAAAPAARAGLNGMHFDYPPEAFTAGTLNGRLIGCLSIQQQLDLHTGYEHQAKDKHDLAELNALDHG